MIGQPDLPDLIRRFLYDQFSPDALICGSDAQLTDCPTLGRLPVNVYHSAIATYHAPSDPSGIGGMHRERIRSTPSWQRGPARRDCVFVEKDAEQPGMRGLHAAHVLLLFSFKYRGERYPCALVQWFVPFGDEPCEDTGMWVVVPDLDADGRRITSVIHLDCILRGAHLIGVYGAEELPPNFHFSETLHSFQSYFVNKFADHHANEIAF